MTEVWQRPKSDSERIEELERRVKELEARPYPTVWPIYVPQPYYIPAQPYYPYYIGGGCVGGVGNQLIWQNANMGGCAAAAAPAFQLTVM